MIKVAMVEDDIQLASVLTEYLSSFNIEVTNYEDPYLALSAIAINKYDIIILDLTLPGMDGLDVCKEITKKYDIPIIISSARSDITDKVIGLELGADDYLPKPYDPRELEIRIKTILRRYQKSGQSETKQVKKLFNYDEKRKIITKNDKQLKLTPAEFELLALFIQRESFVISREDLIDNVESLNGDFDNTGSLSVIINRIRHKIEENPKKPEHLQTVRGMGYKFVQ
jgi:two-component system OmpR family response regulator